MSKSQRAPFVVFCMVAILCGGIMVATARGENGFLPGQQPSVFAPVAGFAFQHTDDSAPETVEGDSIMAAPVALTASTPTGPPTSVAAPVTAVPAPGASRTPTSSVAVPTSSGTQVTSTTGRTPERAGSPDLVTDPSLWSPGATDVDTSGDPSDGGTGQPTPSQQGPTKNGTGTTVLPATNGHHLGSGDHQGTDKTGTGTIADGTDEDGTGGGTAEDGQTGADGAPGDDDPDADELHGHHDQHGNGKAGKGEDGGNIGSPEDVQVPDGAQETEETTSSEGETSAPVDQPATTPPAPAQGEVTQSTPQPGASRQHAGRQQHAHPERRSTPTRRAAARAHRG